MLDLKKLLFLIIILAFVAGIAGAQMGGGITPAHYFYGDGTGVFPVDSTWHLGSESIPIAKGWFTNADVAGVFDLGGTVGSGGIDMSTYLITNIGASGTDFVSGGGLTIATTLGVSATSTLASTTIAGILTVAEDVTFSKDLTVSATTTMASSTINGILTVAGDVTLSQDLTVTATSTLASTTATYFIMSGDIVMSDNSVTGIDTLTFTDTAGTIAGIQNGNLVDKSDTETISGVWTHSVTTTLATTTITRLEVTDLIVSRYLDTSLAHVYLYTTTTQSITTSSTPQDVTWEGVPDEHGDWGVTNGVSTTTVSVPNDGSYRAMYCFQPELSVGANQTFEYALFEGGTEEEGSGGQRWLQSALDIGSSCRMYHNDYTAGDQLTIQISGNSTNIQIAATSTDFTTMPCGTWEIMQIDSN